MPGGRGRYLSRSTPRLQASPLLIVGGMGRGNHSRAVSRALAEREEGLDGGNSRKVEKMILEISEADAIALGG